MKKPMRSCALLLSMMLVIGLAACGTSGSPSGSAAADSSSQAASGTAADAGTADTASEGSVYEERLKLSVAAISPIEGYDYSAGDAWAKFWSDKYNWDVEVIGFTWDNWNEMLRIWVSSRDMPDVCQFNYQTSTHPDASSWINQGLIKQMPDDWRTRWPNAAVVYDKTSLGPQLEQTFGGVYMLPRARFDANLPGDPLPNHMSIHLRKDWAEAVGFPIKDAYKISEIIEYGKLIKEKDPGGMGANLQPMSIRPSYALPMFVGHNSTFHDTYYKSEDGTYQWGAAHEDTLEGLKLYYEAYHSGALNKEFYTLSGDEDRDQFYVAGTSGAVYWNSVPGGMYNDQFTSFQPNVGLDPLETIQIANVLGEDGSYHQQDLINYWGALIFNPDIDDKLFERYMDMLDYGCTEEGYLIQYAGFEGEDYEYVDGKMVSLLPENMPIGGANGKYPSQDFYIVGTLRLADDFAFDSPDIPAPFRERSRELYAQRVTLGTPESFTATDWTVFSHDSAARRRASFDFATEYANIIVNSTSVDELESKWRQWIADQQDLVQPVLDELNSL